MEPEKLSLIGVFWLFPRLENSCIIAPWNLSWLKSRRRPVPHRSGWSG